MSATGISARWIDHERLLWLTPTGTIEFSPQESRLILAELKDGGGQGADLAAKLEEQRPEELAE